MLFVITGPVGSGKTSKLMAKLTEHVKANGRAVLIVPEQASFTAERDVYTALGVFSSGVKVTSFTRLSEQALSEVGAGGVAPLDAAGRCLLMAMALSEVSDMLSVYRRSGYNAAFVEKLVETLDELRFAGITPEALSRAASSGEAGRLRPKLGELALIMDTYQALTQGHFADGADVIALAAQRMGLWESLRGAHVFIDAFAGFTAPEYKVIEAMLAAGCHVSITLCMVRGDSRYEVAQETLSRLRAICERMGLGEPECSKTGAALRYKSDEVAMVAEEALATSSGQWLARGEDVGFYKAASPHDELVCAAVEISRLVREEGYRYRDITVLTRDLSRYKGHVRPVFERYQIPLFMDVKMAAATKLLTGFLQTALKAACRLDGTTPFISLSKSPALGIDPLEAGEFENYCFVWSVKLNDLSSPFIRPIDGFTEKMTDRQRERLDMAERCRQRVCSLVEKLRDGILKGTSADCARALFEALENAGFKENIARFCEDMPEAERRDFLDEQAQLWDGVVGILELFGTVMAQRHMEPARFAELFALCANSLHVAMPPRTLDEVTFGIVDRIRPDNPRAIFILGAVEGEFPRARPPERLLGDRERAFLTSQGYTLIRDADYLSSLEEYNCVLALGGASHRLYISYPCAASSGEPLEPSVLYSGVKELFLEPKMMQNKPQDAVSTMPSAFMALGGGLDEASGVALRRLLDEKGEGERVRALYAQAMRAPRRLSDSGDSLFGANKRLSPSQIERYYSCPFQYFMRDGVKLKPRRRAELSPLESGTLIHEVVSVMLTRHGGKGLSSLTPDAVESEARAIVHDFIASRVGESALDDDRFLYLADKIARSGAALVRRLAEEFAQSLFEPVASELVVGEGGVEPLAVTLPDGRNVIVEGRVDRVDVAQIGGAKYVRVVDYKSSGKRFSLSDVYHGLNMQMLIYLFAICENGEEELGGALPAGVLYMPGVQRYIRVSRDTHAEKIRHKHRLAYKMNGLILDDESLIHAMEPSGEGIFIPSPSDRGATEQLASLEEMGRLSALVELRIAEMDGYLNGGRIEARPLVRGGESCCGWCDYRGVCGFEPGDDVRYLRKMARDEILALGGDCHAEG